MRITAVGTRVLRFPRREPVAFDFRERSPGAAGGRTGEGVTGRGCTLACGGGTEAIEVFLLSRLVLQVGGEYPRDVGGLWGRMFRADRRIERQDIEDGALLNPERPGHGMAVVPGAVERNRAG